MIIDTPWNTTNKLRQLKNQGVTGIVRYYNKTNSSRLPDKRITPAEASAIIDAGLALAIVYQQRQNRLADFDTAKGAAAGHRARELALRIRQPNNSAIYVGVDFDATANRELAQIHDYFAAFGAAVNQFDPKYRIGAYGSGFVLSSLRDAGLIECCWVSMSSGFKGTRDFLASGQWHLRQHAPATQLAGIGVDKNESNPDFANDYGQFNAFGSDHTTRPVAPAEPPPPPPPRAERKGDTDTVSVVDVDNTQLRVTARSGLKVRSGPGKDFEKLLLLQAGTIVHDRGRFGDWVRVDVEGDGLTDGFAHSGFLEEVDM